MAACSTGSTACCSPPRRWRCSACSRPGGPCCGTSPRRSSRRARVTILGATGSVGVSTLDLLGRRAGALRDRGVDRASTTSTRWPTSARRSGRALAVIAEPAGYPALQGGARRHRHRGRGRPAGADRGGGARRPSGSWPPSSARPGSPRRWPRSRRGAVVALANKECLVCAGRAADAPRCSATAPCCCRSIREHNAIFQALAGEAADAVERLILTASGGPFRDARSPRWRAATPSQAVGHPNWAMGAKISVDQRHHDEQGPGDDRGASSVRLAEERIEVADPPAVDRAQPGRVTRTARRWPSWASRTCACPIAYALGWPARIPLRRPRLDLAAVGTARPSEPPDADRFPALAAGPSTPCGRAVPRPRC